MPMLQATRTAIKSVAPNARIVLTGMAGLTYTWLGGSLDTANNFISINWLKDFLDQGGAQYVDVFNIHNYPVSWTSGQWPTSVPPENQNEAVIAAVKTLLAQYPAAAGKPLWLTETGWSTATAVAITESQQASYLVRDVALTLRKGIDRYQIYTLFDDLPDDSPEYRYGLLRNVTNYPAIAPKPSFVSHAVLTRQLDGYTYASTDSLPAGVYSLVFTKAGFPDKRIMWATSPTAAIVASNSTFAVTDRFGGISTATPSGGTASVILTGDPVYVSGSSITGVTAGPPPANLALNKTIYESSHAYNYVAANAVDADPNSYWEGASWQYPANLCVDLGANHTVIQVNMSIPSGWNARSQTVEIFGSTDGVNYPSIVGATAYNFNNTATVNFAPTVQRVVCISITGNSGWFAGQISNLEIIGF